MENKELLLVKLPRIVDVDQDFFAIGYYTDYGFAFALITEDFIHLKPLRSFPFPINNGYKSANQFEILGRIKNLPKY